MKLKNFTYYMGDFETTVYEGQTFTEVWASALVELYTENVGIFHSIDETFEYFKNLPGNLCIFYHNLKFDGSFWLPFLIQKLKLKQAYHTWLDSNGTRHYKWKDEKDMFNGEFKYMISDRGQWYTIIIKKNNRYIEIRDSYKLIPFSVKDIGNKFKTKHKKTSIEYTGYRYAGCEITDEERGYIANDVLVPKEALELMFDMGHNGITIGSCCLKEFKRTYDKIDYANMFPNLYEERLSNEYGALTVGEYIRRSYKGGWCYLVKGKEHKVMHNGITADVNSLYPSMMSSESGNMYPVGKPKFWKGNYIPDEVHNKYWFIRIRTRFKLKPGKLPTVQIKNSFLYMGNEYLETSDVWDSEKEKYVSELLMPDGTIADTRITMTMTCIDYILFREQYYVYDFEILDGCWFFCQSGIFDEYIEKYKKIKIESKEGMRTIAKLFLNNLYGKEAASTDSSFKIAYEKPDGVIGFIPVKENDKLPGYIPCGSAITSYSRNFTIRAAQANYYGVDKPGFIYADTDSIHCDIQAEQVKNIEIHDTDFCKWKLESYWDEAIFTRQKTYIEHVTHEDGKLVKPYYNVRCAGMPQKSKDLFVKELGGMYTLEDFDIGLKLRGKLTPKRIVGGTVLIETTYEMR